MRTSISHSLQIAVVQPFEGSGRIGITGAAICGRLRFCKVFLERLGSKQVAVICPACVRGAYDRWP